MNITILNGSPKGDLKFGPCLGCLHCGFDNICAYEGKDDFNEIYRDVITPAGMLFFLLPLGQRFFISLSALSGKNICKKSSADPCRQTACVHI